MQDYRAAALPLPDRHLDRSQHHLPILTVMHRPADHQLAEEINHNTQEELSFAGRDLGDIGDIRRVLTSATQRTNDNGTTWLQTVPYLPTFDEKKDALIRRPLSMEQQGRLFGALPEQLRRMAEFAVNTGCRDAAVCGLRWDQEVWVEELGASVFVVQNKGGGEMVVPLNASALAAVDACRGDDDEYVFTFRGNRVHRMVSTGWRVAREKSCVEATPHWLRHTFAGRLRSAGVSVEDRAELMGHSNSNVTTHYSAADLRRLLQAVRLIDPDQQGRVCEPLIVVKARR